MSNEGPRKNAIRIHEQHFNSNGHKIATRHVLFAKAWVHNWYSVLIQDISYYI